MTMPYSDSNPEPLYLNNNREWIVSGLTNGQTVELRICASRAGLPSAIGSLTTSTTADASSETLGFTGAALASDLATRVGQDVWLLCIVNGTVKTFARRYRVSDMHQDI